MALAASEKVFGFKTRAKESPVVNNVGVTPAVILQNNPDRVSWLIVNLGPADLYLAFSGEVSSTRGMRLSALGGFASMVFDEDGEAVAYEVWGVAGGAANALYAQEIERVILGAS